MSDTRRDVAKLIKDLEKAGYEVTRTGSGHWKVRYPGRPGCVILAFSPKKPGLNVSMRHLRTIGYDPRG